MDPKRLVQRGKPDVVWLNLDTQARRMDWLQHHASVLLGSSLYLWELSFHICKMGMLCVPCEIMVYNFFFLIHSVNVNRMLTQCLPLPGACTQKTETSIKGLIPALMELWLRGEERFTDTYSMKIIHPASIYWESTMSEAPLDNGSMYHVVVALKLISLFFFFLFWILALRKVEGKSN